MTMTAGSRKADDEAFPGLDDRLAKMTSPPVNPSASAAPVSPWEDQARRLSRSASRAARVFPGVASAHFDITGTASGPALELDCTLYEGHETPSVIRRLTHTVVADLEEMLGTEFTERHINVRVERDGAPGVPMLTPAS